MENIPSKSAAILVWYHGPIPVDYFGLVARLYLRDGRLVNSVVDRFLTTLPQWSDVEHHFKVTSAGKGYCVELLEHGELLGVAVGGAREAFLDFDYAADWGNRQGFAKVALLTGLCRIRCLHLQSTLTNFRGPHNPYIYGEYQRGLLHNEDRQEHLEISV